MTIMMMKFTDREFSKAVLCTPHWSLKYYMFTALLKHNDEKDHHHHRYRHRHHQNHDHNLVLRWLLATITLISLLLVPVRFVCSTFNYQNCNHIDHSQVMNMNTINKINTIMIAIIIFVIFVLSGLYAPLWTICMK